MKALCAILCGVSAILPTIGRCESNNLGRRLVEASGVQGGLVVHVGCGSGAVTKELHVNDRYLVHGLETDPDRIAAARQLIDAAGEYGQVSVDRFDGRQLPYADGLVNLLVLDGAEAGGGEGRSGSGLTLDEAMRVLAPRGILLVHADARLDRSGIDASTRLPLSDTPRLDGWIAYRKSVPAEIDDWSHYLHGPDNNAVGRDQLVGPPRRLQWTGDPAWARHHDHMASLVALVSSAGRLFYIVDEGPVSSIQLPARWTLAARDAFNGKILWKQPITSWWPHVWPNKLGPSLLPRRLVADAGRVYVTLGLNAPVSALDAATGAVVQTYPASRATEEIVLSDGVLYLVVTDRVDPPTDPATMQMRETAGKWTRDTSPRTILAVRSDTGEVLWNKRAPILPMTLAVDANQVYYHDGDALVSLDRRTGKPLWESSPIPRAVDTAFTYSGPTLVVADDVVLFAGGESIKNHRGGQDTMTALSRQNGKQLWTAPHPPSGYDSPEDLFVIDGLVWTAPLTNRRDSGLFTGRDLKTGEIVREYPDTTGQHMPHHRCHRAKATERYILTSRTGIEFVDIHGQEDRSRHDWVRGGCLYGIMPANGMVYAPPHACACYALAKLNGFNALAPAADAGDQQDAKSADERLELGPAHNEGLPADEPDSGRPSWPTYRHDNRRSGSTDDDLQASLGQRWAAQIGGRLSPLVVDHGRCYVASIDAHSVHALDAQTGKDLWKFTAGGRIDSPPTVHRGRVVFGSRDGWVYCLRAGDGALAWRFQAAPLDERILSYEQLESAWPVNGSVLIVGDEVHCVAGRSMFLEGGMRYLRLQLETGELISENVMDDRYPETGEPLDAAIRWPHLPTALPDILSCDGEQIYMRTQAFDLKGKRLFVPDIERPHLFAAIGLLDGSWWHRSYWIYGNSMGGGAGGWPTAGQKAPAGRILVFNDDEVFGYRRNAEHFSSLTVGSWMEYHLFAMAKSPELKEFPIQELPPLNRKQRVSNPVERWSVPISTLVRAMTLTPKTLFVAGLPDILDEQPLNFHRNDPELQAKAAAQADAWQGASGGTLMAIAPADGAVLARYQLGAVPTFDGMAVAEGRLYIVQEDGSVVCFAP